MPNDWKNDYQRKLDEERKKGVEKWEREKKEEEQKRQEVERKKELERQREIEKWGKRYKCNICGEPSKHKESVYLCVQGLNEVTQRETRTKLLKWFGQWDYIPLDLSVCEKCRKWFCSEHIYVSHYKIGICKHCAGY